jgi:drug/metabolite transporter superfamily protein YnfA
MMLQRSRLLIATLWVGALWTTGFIVAPTLFATLADRALAGTIAGSLFRVIAWLSIVCAVVLLVLQWLTSRKADTVSSARGAVYLVFGMVFCTLVGYFGLQPYMAELRLVLHGTADMTQVVDAQRQFGMLHAASTGIYIVQSLLGLALILKIR